MARRSFETIGESCRLFNMYGPTEATIIAAVMEIKRGEEDKYGYLSSIPIGKAAGNTFLYILNKYMNLCPVQVVGELYIGGEGVACGYLNNPELTAERFRGCTPGYKGGRWPVASIIEDIGGEDNREDNRGQANIINIKINRSFWESRTLFSKRGLYPWQVLTAGGILYKTGDLARWLEDGNIEYIGRVDFQVKIRGFRIELGEIENSLLKHEKIKEAVVIDRTGADGDKYICAYVVPVGELDLPEVREYLSKGLPGYMVPSYFVQVDEIPLSPSGKVDRKALPDPGVMAGREYVAPRNVVEKKLVQIWSEVLSLPEDSIGIEDNFFILGGHSLKVVVMLAKLHKEFNIKLPVMEIFKDPTIKGISSMISVFETTKLEVEDKGTQEGEESVII